MANVTDSLFPLAIHAFPFLYEKLAAAGRAPFLVQLETTSRCNLACPMCTRTHAPKPPRDMSFAEAEAIVDSILHLHGRFVTGLARRLLLFDLTGVGEPLLNPEFTRIAAMIKSRGLSVTFADNFTLMDQDTAEQLVRAQVDLVFASFDGGTKPTYEYHRKGAKFETVVENIRGIMNVRDRLRSAKPQVALRCLVTGKNVHELADVVALAAEIGLRRVSFDHVNTSPCTREFRVGREEFERHRIPAARKAHELGISVNFARYGKRPFTKCRRPFNSVNITCEGIVLPCCFANEDKDYAELVNGHSLGNILTEDIGHIWRSERYGAFRRALRDNRPPAFCRDCYLYGEVSRDPDCRPPTG